MPRQKIIRRAKRWTKETDPMEGLAEMVRESFKRFKDKHGIKPRRAYFFGKGSQPKPPTQPEGDKE